MGRAANRKWQRRVQQFNRAKHVSLRLWLKSLYGGHRKFRPGVVGL